MVREGGAVDRGQRESIVEHAAQGRRIASPLAFVSCSEQRSPDERLRNPGMPSPDCDKRNLVYEAVRRAIHALWITRAIPIASIGADSTMPMVSPWASCSICESGSRKNSIAIRASA